MASRLLSLSCIRNDAVGGGVSRNHGDLSPRPHYPSMPKYPKGKGTPQPSDDEEKGVLGSESKAVFTVTGMTCSACAGSVEKAVKRLPGIKEAVLDVLNDRAQVLFYPNFVNVCYIIHHL